MCERQVTAVAIALIGWACACGRSPPPPEQGLTTDTPAATRITAPNARPLYVVGHLHRYEVGAAGLSGLEERIQRVAEMGFAGVRLGLEWPRIEASPGYRSWEQIDAIVELLQANGLVAYGLLTLSPDWARPQDTRPTHRPVLGGSVAAGDSAFASFSAAAARRYAGVIDTWEIWNEPNLERFWSHVSGGADTGPDPADYLSLFGLARDAILAANPDAVVMTGGLAAGPSEMTFRSRRLAGSRTGYPAAHFLEGLLDLGLKPPAVGLHPYLPLAGRLGTAPPDSLNPRLTEVLAVLDRYDLDATDVYVTEWGIDEKLVRPGAVAAWFQAGLTVLSCSHRVRLLTIYALTDWGESSRYGLLDSSGELTEAGGELRRFLTENAQCP